MNTDADSQELLNFFKAMADPNRLKIVGLLAQGPLSVEQMAEMLGRSSSTISHHLQMLTHSGLVSARAEGYYSVYRLETGVLESMAQRLLHRESWPAVAADVDVDAYDRKVFKSYLTPEGRINDFPVQMKKMEAILRYVVKAFEPGERYPEKQVNEILSQFSDDTARLRRNLVEFKLMDRQGGGGEYWRVDE
jgi:predicted transcriptional regulator